MAGCRGRGWEGAIVGSSGRQWGAVHSGVKGYRRAREYRAGAPQVLPQQGGALLLGQRGPGGTLELRGAMGRGGAAPTAARARYGLCAAGGRRGRTWASNQAVTASSMWGTTRGMSARPAAEGASAAARAGRRDARQGRASSARVAHTVLQTGGRAGGM